MVTFCGELAALSAVIVTVPLRKILLTVTVWLSPALIVPLLGVISYMSKFADALHSIAVPPLLVTVNVLVCPNPHRSTLMVGG